MFFAFSGKENFCIFAIRLQEGPKPLAFTRKIMKFRMLFIVCSCVFCLVTNNCCVTSGTDKLPKELTSIEKDIPLPYHEDLDEILESRAAQPVSKDFLQHESFLDSALGERNMPRELKYLPLALSGMRPNYRQGDRCGFWAMPSLVAMRYGLTINEEVDERMEMNAATAAALDYLADLYQNYHDWWYAILAYSNSPNSLNQALVQSGETPLLWDFYKKELMPETQVIADLIAYIYLANEKKLTFGEVAEAEETPAIVEEAEGKESESLTEIELNDPSFRKYKVKKGDTLTKIAKKYHVKISELMEWNKLNDDKILEGQILIIKK